MNAKAFKEKVEQEKINNFIKQHQIIERMNKTHEKVRGGNLMVPMLKLSLLDNTEGMDLDYTIEALDESLRRAKTWKEWLEVNHTECGISGVAVYTAREDRNMLSIVLGIDFEMDQPGATNTGDECNNSDYLHNSPSAS